MRAGACGWTGWRRAPGSRGNLLYDNTTDDLFVEVNHGPFLVDNNVFLSRPESERHVRGRRLRA